ncbi:MAG TPA: peptidase T [Elusimicrobia bacterium]|nr:peptidase T [Elusimicrobiota bacterium]
MKESLLDRFLRYVKIDTQSKEGVEDKYPSTDKQLVLLKMLKKELEELGVQDVRMDQYGYVMASLPANVPHAVPAVGLIAHVDTSEAVSGENVKPQVFEYRGGDIVLPGDPSVVIGAADNPDLKNWIGKRIITSDGTTLLGADDKAGVAVIMTAVDRLLSDPKIPHGPVKIAFTPDEEVGGGTKFFDLKAFGAEAAYTVDGDKLGDLNKETFSADMAVVTVHGREVHPGLAKDKMVNSIRAMADLIARLPKGMAPETTSGHKPFIHPYKLEASAGKSVLQCLLRDFKTEGLAKQKSLLEGLIAKVQPKHPKAKFELTIKEYYRNMKEGLEKDTRVTKFLFAAAKRAGADPKWVPIRGGTDGSRLTAMGLPTPNLFTGSSNFHSKTEWTSVEAMEKSLETVVNVLQIWAKKCR